MNRAINTFFYIAIFIALAGVILGALYGAVVAAGITFINFIMDSSDFFGFIQAVFGIALLGIIFGGYFGAIGGVPLGIAVGLAVAIAQARYTRPYTTEQARFIGRVGDVIALIACVGAVLLSAGSGVEIFLIGMPAIIAFVACHKVVLRYLRKHTHAGKSKAKNIA